MWWRLQVFVLVLLCAAGAAVRADPPKPMTDRDLAELRQIVNPEDQIAIVFIPGILGSKLAVEEKVIWGGVFNFDKALAYDPAKPASAEVFDRVEIDVLVTKFGINVYGNAIQDLKDQFSDATTDVFVFPYDWRQSNLTTSGRLQELFCIIAGNTRKNGGRTSFIIAAHSMGGIVLKSWLVTHWRKNDSCGDFRLSESSEIERLFFLGTPHAGATRFVESMIEEYTLGDSSEWFGRLLASGLNDYGASFESVYELLPIFQSERCRRQIPKGHELPQYVFMRVDEKPRPIDLFDSRRWRDLMMPKRVPEIPGGEDYYASFLPRQLKRSEGLLCALLAYDFGSEPGKSVFFFGRQAEPNTIDTLVLTRYRNLRSGSMRSLQRHKPDDVVIEDRSRGYGDGTVLEDVAGAEGMVDPVQAHMSPFAHASLPDDPSFRKQMAWTIRRAKEEQIRIGAARPGGLERLTSYLSRYNLRFPEAMDVPGLARPLTATWTAQTNRALYPKFPERAQRSDWQTNNDGLALLRQGDFSGAQKLMAPVAERLLAAPGGDRRLRARLFNTYGWALFRIGRFDEAERSFSAARNAGNARAMAGLAEIARARSLLQRVGRASLRLEGE